MTYQGQHRRAKSDVYDCLVGCRSWRTEDPGQYRAAAYSSGRHRSRPPVSVRSARQQSASVAHRGVLRYAHYCRFCGPLWWSGRFTPIFSSYLILQRNQKHWLERQPQRVAKIMSSLISKYSVNLYTESWQGLTQSIGASPFAASYHRDISLILRSFFF